MKLRVNKLKRTNNFAIIINNHKDNVYFYGSVQDYDLVYVIE